MIRRTTFVTLLMLLAIRAGFAACPQTNTDQTCRAVSACPTQPPIYGLITIVQPDGQFYTDFSAKDQVYCDAELRIIRCGREIGRAELIEVNPLDSVAQLVPACQGLRCQQGDLLELISTPLPSKMRNRLPDIEIDLESENNEALAFEILGTLIGMGIAINQD